MLPLDHLVYAVPDLEVAVDELAESLGAVAIPGGRHPGLGTRNAILPLEGGCYLELIARDEEADAPRGPRPFGLDGLAAPRLVTWAARSTRLDDDVEAARDRGFDPGVIAPVDRAQPDGTRLRWRLTLREDPGAGGLVPFLIDWGEAPHPSTASAAVCRVEAFTGTHPEPAPVLEMLAALGVALPVEAGEPAGLRASLIGPEGVVVLRG